MMLSFKKRIALFNTMAVAITTAMVFAVIYGVVYYSSYRHLDNDINLEREDVLKAISWKGESIVVHKMPEWEEAEHKNVEVNPTFIQIVDIRDSLLFKSVNLRSNNFLFNPKLSKEQFFNIQIQGQRLRLGQFPIINESNRVIGQLTIGVSQQESYHVLNNLLVTLCISFPVLLIILYVVIYLAASRAIAPVQQLIKTASGIHDSNIQTRLPLPEHKDEIHQLTSAINELLNRIEKSIQQQKQFTADASHEIRTPLSAIRGTLEVLLRKKREPEQYEEKIRDVIEQTDRLHYLLDQLLQLARLESAGDFKKEHLLLDAAIEQAIGKNAKQVTVKRIHIEKDIPPGVSVYADGFCLDVIIENLVGNAVKYSPHQGTISCKWNTSTHTLFIQNEGPGIPEDQLPFIFNRFYRTDQSRSAAIPGSGLGLAIVKKLAELQHIGISVVSQPGKTIFSLSFSQ
jgi:two-component system, OmpR family, heavy metal sensor histidine kinase CusS